MTHIKYPHLCTPITIGALNDPAQMEEIIASGQADIVEMTRALLADPELPNKVLGGGLAGCECAVHLGMEGKQVHLVEMRDTLAPDCNIRHRPILMQQVEKYTTAHTGCQGLRVTAEGLICRNAAGDEVLIPGKAVICAVGQRSNRAAVEELRYSAPWVREIGDCAQVSNITNAIYQGYHAALDI